MRKDYSLVDGKIELCVDLNKSTIIVFMLIDEVEKKFLINEFNIDEHTLNSAHDPDELSRFEIEPDHAAVIYKRPKNYSANDKLIFKVSSTGIFL